jgi:Flp pilus assembly protein TadG
MSLQIISAVRRTTGPLGGLLSRLGRDTRGNTLIIVAAAVLPLLAMIGSGIDMGRGYLAQTRLQQACDAAALAGRRAMVGGVVTTTVTDEAKKFFTFNYKTGTVGVDGSAAFGSKGFAPVIGSAANATVTVTASTTLPTTVMKIFGFASLPLQVSCFAKQDFVNTDIALVLDTTGSMLDDVNGNAANGGSTSKIAGLRNAVMALYDQLAPVQAQLEAAGLRLRYSIVPYSSAVNVGGAIYQANPTYLRDTSSYQTRLANYTTPVYAPSGTPTVTNETYGSNITVSNCIKYGYNQPFTGFVPNPAGEPIAGTTTLTYYLPSKWNNSTTIVNSTSGTLAACVRTKTVYPSYTTRYTFTNFTYDQGDAVDTSDFKTGASTSVATQTASLVQGTNTSRTVIGGSTPTASSTKGFDGVYVAANTNSAEILTVATGIDANGVLQVPARVAGTNLSASLPPAKTSYIWSGNNQCIEERKTVSTITASSGYAVPSGAYDLNIDYIPNNDDTRWTPHWPEMIWYRAVGLHNGDSRYNNKTLIEAWGADSEAYYACPSAAVRLKAFSRDQMQTYVDGLQAVGGTYHDIGMIWGARMLSGDGIFAADNPATYGNMPMSRFIIFLTDGQMAPNDFTYTTYGVEYLDKRVTGSSSATGQLADHEQRMKMICQAAKTKGVSIWVIAFATGLSSALRECASNSGQASTSSSQTDLINKFTEIGKNIGALRLTQ